MGANRNKFIENASKILLSKSEEYKCIIDKIEHYLNKLLEDVKGIRGNIFVDNGGDLSTRYAESRNKIESDSKTVMDWKVM